MTTPAGSVSGTAAVVARASRHHEDVAAQLDETLTMSKSLDPERARSTAQGHPARAACSRSTCAMRTTHRSSSTKLAEKRDTDGILVFAATSARREAAVESTACTPEREAPSR